MKVATMVFALCVATVTAAPPLQNEVASRADCSWCTSMYDFCVKVSHSHDFEAIHVQDTNVSSERPFAGSDRL